MCLVTKLLLVCAVTFFVVAKVTSKNKTSIKNLNRIYIGDNLVELSPDFIKNILKQNYNSSSVKKNSKINVNRKINFNFEHQTGSLEQNLKQEIFNENFPNGMTIANIKRYTRYTPIINDYNNVNFNNLNVPGEHRNEQNLPQNNLNSVQNFRQNFNANFYENSEQNSQKIQTNLAQNPIQNHNFQQIVSESLAQKYNKNLQGEGNLNKKIPKQNLPNSKQNSLNLKEKSPKIQSSNIIDDYPVLMQNSFQDNTLPSLDLPYPRKNSFQENSFPSNQYPTQTSYFPMNEFQVKFSQQNSSLFDQNRNFLSNVNLQQISDSNTNHPQQNFASNANHLQQNSALNTNHLQQNSVPNLNYPQQNSASNSNHLQNFAANINYHQRNFTLNTNQNFASSTNFLRQDPSSNRNHLQESSVPNVNHHQQNSAQNTNYLQQNSAQNYLQQNFARSTNHLQQNSVPNANYPHQNSVQNVNHLQQNPAPNSNNFQQNSATNANNFQQNSGINTNNIQQNSVPNLNDFKQTSAPNINIQQNSNSDINYLQQNSALNADFAPYKNNFQQNSVSNINHLQENFAPDQNFPPLNLKSNTFQQNPSSNTIYQNIPQSNSPSYTNYHPQRNTELTTNHQSFPQQNSLLTHENFLGGNLPGQNTNNQNSASDTVRQIFSQQQNSYQQNSPSNTFHQNSPPQDSRNFQGYNTERPSNQNEAFPQDFPPNLNQPLTYLTPPDLNQNGAQYPSQISNARFTNGDASQASTQEIVPSVLMPAIGVLPQSSTGQNYMSQYAPTQSYQQNSQKLPQQEHISSKLMLMLPVVPMFNMQTSNSQDGRGNGYFYGSNNQDGRNLMQHYHNSNGVSNDNLASSYSNVNFGHLSYGTSTRH